MQDQSSATLLQSRWQRVRDAIATRAQDDDRDPPCLVAVSKLQPAAAIAELSSVGQRHFGENYVQEAADKMRELADLRPQLVWHLIGHLQSNKAEQAAELFDWVHSVDRLKLVTALGKGRMATHDSPLNVLIQVNIDDQDSKSGCSIDAINDLANAIIETPGLQLRGLMTIGQIHTDPELARPTFRQLENQFELLQSKIAILDTLSMGMSGDYLQAIDEGATMLRVGSAIFGDRPAKSDNP